MGRRPTTGRHVNARKLPSLLAVRRLKDRRAEAARVLKEIADEDPDKRRNEDLAEAAVAYAEAKKAHENAEDARSMGRWSSSMEVEDANEDSGEE